MDKLQNLALELRSSLTAQGWRLTTAESCTGGWVSQVITSIAGSSTWFDRGFVAYTDAAKHEMIGVPQEILSHFGAVSVEAAAAMAEGALAGSQADVAISITGIAGPDGGSADKPVGTVCFGFTNKSGVTETSKQLFDGDRGAVRAKSVAFALIECHRFMASGAY